jgi:hypothetical protein
LIIKKKLTVNELAILLERNKHKFIFYSYFGGMGGEFILNYLADNVPNIISQKDSALMQGFYMMGWDFKTRTANKHYFADTIFGHYFLDAAQRNFINDSTEGWASTFDELAEKILTAQKGINYGYPEHDFNSLFDLDKHEDMRYLVKIHNWYDELKLFKGAKMINTAPVEWKKHCAMICLAKNETNCVYTKDEKKDRIERLLELAEWGEDDSWTGQHEYKHGRTPLSSIEIVTEYLSDIIENDDVPLYDNTINMALQPTNYDLDMTVTFAEEINNIETLQKLYFSKFMDEENTDEDIYNNAGYKVTKSDDELTLEEYLSAYDVTKYDFNDIANGEWIAQEFGISAEEFRNTFDDWFDKNIEVLNNLGLSNHYIPTKSLSYIPRSERKDERKPSGLVTRYNNGSNTRTS